MTIDEWYSMGLKRGWISSVSCYYHDMLPLTEAEEAELESSDEICVGVLRFYG